MPMVLSSLEIYGIRNLLDDYVDYPRPITNINYLIPLVSPFWYGMVSLLLITINY